MYGRSYPVLALMGGTLRRGPRLGNIVRCCPDGRGNTPCYDENGNFVYMTASSAPYGDCGAMPLPPPPAPPAPGTAVPAPSPVTVRPPAQVTYPIQNMTFPSGMQEPPLQKFTQLPANARQIYAAQPQPAYPPAPSYPPGATIPVSDWFGICKKSGGP